MQAKKIVYPAVPSHYDDATWEKILEFIRRQGHVPVDHRRGMPRKDFEDVLGRPATLTFLIKVMKICDAVWIFGRSPGVMGEWQAALDLQDAGGQIEIKVFPEFDPGWAK